MGSLKKIKCIGITMNLVNWQEVVIGEFLTIFNKMLVLV